MMKRKIIFMLGISFFMAFLAVEVFPQASNSTGTARLFAAERRRNVSETARKREAAKRRKNLESKKSEPAKEDTNLRAKIEAERRQKEAQEKWDRTKKELLYEKQALGVTEEQWKLIKPKLEKVRELRGKASSTVGSSLTSLSIGGQNPPDTQSVPTWQWNAGWMDKAPGELTEAQKIAEELIRLLDKENATPEQFKQEMDILRKARLKEAEIESQLAKARRELREGLTPRQEAALVLIGWL